MAINQVTFAYKQRLDKDDWNDLSDNAVNGFSGASAGDDIHRQYMSSRAADETKVNGIFRVARTGNLTFSFTPTAFGWYTIAAGRTTTPKRSRIISVASAFLMITSFFYEMGVQRQVRFGALSAN